MDWLWKLSSTLPLEISITSLALFKYIHREGEGWQGGKPTKGRLESLPNGVASFVVEFLTSINMSWENINIASQLMNI